MADLLDAFLGEWRVHATFPSGGPIGDIAGHATFERMLDDRYLVQRSTVDHPDAPNLFAVVAPDAGGGYTQHYFDSRGVVRIYEMTFDGRTWTLSREQADFGPLEFKQRYVGTFDDDGRTIRGAWEICHDGETWEKDFDLNYVRVD
jgi:hypothetical protein